MCVCGGGRHKGKIEERKRNKKNPQGKGGELVLRWRAGMERKVNENERKGGKEECRLTYLQDKTKSSVMSKCMLD